MKKIDGLLEQLGLYKRSWLGYDNVIKLKSNDYTILINHYGYWEWYNEEDFNLIDCDEKLKEELKAILKPKNGYQEKVKEPVNENKNTWFKTEQIETAVNVTGDMTADEIKASRKKLVVLHECGEDKEALIGQLETMIQGLKTDFESFAG
jgi:hypothetical protein